MRRAWNGWLDRITALESGGPLALFRILIGLIVFVDLGLHILAGVVDPLFIPLAEGGLAPGEREFSLGKVLFGRSGALAWSAVGIGMASSLLLTIGVGGRFVALVVLQCLLYMHSLPDDIGGGYDRLLTNALFLLVIGNATATYSLDCRLRTGRWSSSQPIYAFARYIGIVQLAIVYTHSGFEKSGGRHWRYPYDAVYNALQRWPYVRFGELDWLGHAYPLTQIGTFVSSWWESFFILALVWWVAHLGWVGSRWQARAARFDLRWPLLGVGVVMHVVLGILLNVGTFSLVSLAFYVLWLDPRPLGPTTRPSEPA